MLATKITRYSFFRGKTQYERYTEHAPLCAEEPSHALCNCTKTVTERPPGEPESVSQIVTFTGTVGEYRMVLEMATHFRGTERFLASETHDDCSVDFRVYWPRPEGKPLRRFDSPKKTEEHASFHFLRDNHLKVNVEGTGDHGDIDCTLGTVLFGNRVDTSRFFNGHSPSRLDLSRIDPDDVWVHDRSFGTEAWGKVLDTWETDRLWRLQALARQIRSEVAPLSTADVPVTEVRARVTATQADRWLVVDAFQILEKVLLGFQDSALRKEVCRVDEEARQGMLARAQAEREEERRS